MSNISRLFNYWKTHGLTKTFRQGSTFLSHRFQEKLNMTTFGQLVVGFFKTLKKFGLGPTVRLTFVYIFKMIKNRGTASYINQLPGASLARALEFEVLDIDFDALDKSPAQPLNDKSPYVWYVPAWTNVWGGGHLTLFRWAHLMNARREQIIYVYNNAGRFAVSYFKDSLEEAFPGNKINVITKSTEIPKSAISIATTWQSVFSVLKFTHSDSLRFYFMQDYESLFYAHGTDSMQALDSYEHKLIGVTGGPWLLSKFREHGGDGINYVFTTDRSIYYPLEEPRDRVKRVFFYGRPSTERRCFELGVETLRILKNAYPDIEIVVAGLDGIGDLGFDVTMAGSVPLPKLGELYRSCDIGLALSGTNLSYLPVELMATGVPVVTNGGPHVEWYCEDRVNSLVVPPFPTPMFKALKTLIEDKELRNSIREGGLLKSQETDWAQEASKIQTFIEAKASSL